MGSGDQQPQNRNEVSGSVWGDVYQAQNLNVIQKFPPVEKPRPPRCLPGEPLLFVNRLGEKRKAAMAATGNDMPVIMISGRSGVGASTFAVQWGYWFEERYPDGTLYHDMREDQAEGGTAVSAVLAKFLKAFQCDVPPEFSSRQERYRSYLRDKRVLVILDHVESRAEVEALRPLAAGSAMIATCSHKGDFVTGQKNLSIEPFEFESAHKLVSELVDDERVSEAESDIAELIELCEGIPKLLSLAVGPMERDTHMTPAEVVAWLRAELDRDSTAPPDRESILGIVAGAAYESLSDDAARLYRMLGCHPGLDVAKEAIDALFKSPGGGFKVVNELCDRHLLDRYAKDRYRLPWLVQAHALAQARTVQDAEDQALSIWTEWYVGCAQAADRVYIHDRNRVFSFDVRAPRSFDSDKEAMSWLDAERHNLLALQRRLSDRGRFRPVMRLGEAMWVLYISALYLEDWKESSELSVAAAVADNHVVAEVRLRAFLARALMENAPNAPDPGQTRAAAERELDKARDLPVSGSGLDYRASAIEFKGRLLSYQGHYREAIEHHTAALELFAQRALDPDAPEHERRANRRGVALQHQFIGRCRLDGGEYAAAKESLREAESRMDDDLHYRDIAKIRTWIGEALRNMGDMGGAHQVLTQAVNALEGGTWYRGESEALWQLSLVAEERQLHDLERICLERLRERYFVAHNPRLNEVEARLEHLSGE